MTRKELNARDACLDRPHVWVQVLEEVDGLRVADRRILLRNRFEEVLEVHKQLSDL